MVIIKHHNECWFVDSEQELQALHVMRDGLEGQIRDLTSSNSQNTAQKFEEERQRLIAQFREEKSQVCINDFTADNTIIW